MIDERIAERRASVRDERRRRRLRRTTTIAALLVIVVGVVAVEQSALVGLEEIRVVGVERLDADEVRQAAGLSLGTSTLRLGLGDARQRIEDLALVRRAELSRVDPLTVLIEVEERRPVLVVDGAGTQVLVDRDGVVLREGALDGLPRIRLTGRPPDSGEHVEDDPALRNAHAVWRGLSGPLRAEVVRYEARSAEQLTLRLASGVEVRFGRAERLPEKIRALGAVLADVGSTPIDAIDVRAPGAPVVVGAP